MYRERVDGSTKDDETCLTQTGSNCDDVTREWWYGNEEPQVPRSFAVRTDIPWTARIHRVTISGDSQTNLQIVGSAVCSRVLFGIRCRLRFAPDFRAEDPDGKLERHNDAAGELLDKRVHLEDLMGSIADRHGKHGDVDCPIPPQTPKDALPAEV